MLLPFDLSLFYRVHCTAFYFNFTSLPFWVCVCVWGTFIYAVRRHTKENKKRMNAGLRTAASLERGREGGGVGNQITVCRLFLRFRFCVVASLTTINTRRNAWALSRLMMRVGRESRLMFHICFWNWGPKTKKVLHSLCIFYFPIGQSSSKIYDKILSSCVNVGQHCISSSVKWA